MQIFIVYQIVLVEGLQTSQAKDCRGDPCIAKILQRSQGILRDLCEPQIPDNNFDMMKTCIWEVNRCCKIYPYKIQMNQIQHWMGLIRMDHTRNCW